MFPIEKCPVPVNTMLEKYSINGAYVDCYSIEVLGQISFPEYIYAFYTTFLFKLERIILAWTVSKPSRDDQARQLSNGDIENFAAWYVENRSKNEILMCDFRGRTRSWLMTVSVNGAGDPRTRLYFGSAVVPFQGLKTGKQSIGLVYRSLLGFHKIYSVSLLYSAKLRIQRQLLREKN